MSGKDHTPVANNLLIANSVAMSDEGDKCETDESKCVHLNNNSESRKQNKTAPIEFLKNASSFLCR